MAVQLVKLIGKFLGFSFVVTVVCISKEEPCIYGTLNLQTKCIELKLKALQFIKKYNIVLHSPFFYSYRLAISNYLNVFNSE